MSTKQRERDFKQICVFAVVEKPSFDIEDALWDSFVMLQHLHCVLDLLKTRIVGQIKARQGHLRATHCKKN